MAESAQKVTLPPSRDIPFDKLVLSQSNVRRIKAGIPVEELAKYIARRELLRSLSVRSVLTEHEPETGKFEIPASGRRFQALSLIVKQERLPKKTPIPCTVQDARSTILAEDDSLAKDMQRAALHLLDQFQAFVALRDNGQGDEEITATFFVTLQVVKQHLKLAAVAPALLEFSAEVAMTLAQSMAFTANPEHERQIQAWKPIKPSWNKEPYQLRCMLTETSVRATDRRAVFTGGEAVSRHVKVTQLCGLRSSKTDPSALLTSVRFGHRGGAGVTDGNGNEDPRLDLSGWAQHPFRGA